MKKYISILLLTMVLLSCSKGFLEEKTFGLIRPTDYFTSVSDLEKCVNALFSNSITMWRKSACMAPCMGGDDVTTQSGGNKAGYLQFDTFSAEDNNDKIKDSWTAPYNTIKQANVILTNIDKFVEPADNQPYLKDQKNRALGQAYFLRALSYFNLVRIFGEIPVFEDVSIDYNIKKSSFEEIYKLIVSDLIKSESLLPDDFMTASNASTLEKTTAYARPTKGSVKALMASVYLTMAGYPLKDNTKFALAAQKAKEVIDSESKYGYVLLSNFADLWKAANNINHETVFGFYFNHKSGGTDQGASVNGNMLAPLAFLPEDFGGYSDAYAELSFFNEFPAGPRKDATFIAQGQMAPTSPLVLWQNFKSKHPHYNKYIDVPGYDPKKMGSTSALGFKSARTVPVIRYAEVLLVYAEAKAMSDGPDALAYTCLNRVRIRAGLGSIATGLSPTAFRDKIIEERKWEFAGMEPNARWFDMVRTETVESATSKRDPSEVSLINQPSKGRYFAPIPQADAILNPNL